MLGRITKFDSTLHKDSMTNVKIICDLELLEFKLIAPFFLLERPCSIHKKLNLADKIRNEQQSLMDKCIQLLDQKY